MPLQQPLQSFPLVPVPSDSRVESGDSQQQPVVNDPPAQVFYDLSPDPGHSDLIRVDAVAEDLHVQNVTAAVVLGVRVSQAAIRQVLTGGVGPLGERR